MTEAQIAFDAALIIGFVLGTICTSVIYNCLYRDKQNKSRTIQEITPTNEKLLKLAKKYAPPQEWYDEEIELFEK